MQETLVQQSPESSHSLPVLYKKDNSQSADYNPIQGAIQLWATLSDKNTAVVYQQASSKTWQIFKQAIAVVLFLFALLIALIIWVLGIAFQSGQYFRNWLEIKQPNLDEIVSTLFKYLLLPLERAYQLSASFIKEYLGWEIKFDPLRGKSPATKLEETNAFATVSSESSSTKDV
ncbi:hypothetical protein [Brunnivagina elsteri]|uniref:Uncharacterized protein n=1 Tax=Brunnivagina elsteri CCALA 953 TaxID=987040 RepID=A0A2A2TGY6_9CYAN|nr:hypothetical protein [Calothrix elsteri]PAX53014.1 hypothetical protein CK510_16280 [Calothrix elsteri CCALA 953]